ncbi:histone deacetylase [Coemansia nantahalensis]|nr:histone deacetylase [Coemansia nantahalensis]
MDRKLPMNDYMDYYAPEYTLSVPAYNVDNSNSPEYLDRIKNQVLQNLRRTCFAPSVQMQDVPRDVDRDVADEDSLDPDERMPEPLRDQHVVPETEMYEADAIGLSETTRDGTRVVNEETNVAAVDHDTTSVDVKMEDAQPSAPASATAMDPKLAVGGPAALKVAPAARALAAEREEGEATEDDYDDEDGEIR